MKNNESTEMYLETILVLSKQLPVVRSVDVANELGFKKSSVSIAMKHLREKKLITVTDSGFIYLTDEGKNISEMIYDRHQLLTSFFTKIGVSEEIASEDACRIEHVISTETINAIKKHIEDIIKICGNNVGNKYTKPNKNTKITIKNKKIYFEKI